MKRVWCGIAAVVGLAALVGAQTGQVRVVTRPAAPNREVLDRLSIEVAWRTKVRFQNSRDGLFSVQLLPGKDGPELLVQTLQGAALLFDAETGDLKWRMPLEGKVLAEGGANSQSVFVARGAQLYVLNRKTGMHRVYAKQEGYPDPVMGYTLPATPSAPLVADDAGLFVAMGQRLTAYIHPDFELALELTKKEYERPFEAPPEDGKKLPFKLEQLKAEELERLKAALEEIRGEEKKAETKRGTTLQPIALWSYYTTASAIQQAPLTTYDQVCVVTSAGNFLALNRFESKLVFEFKTQGAVSAPMGQYGLTAYVGSDDYALYALDMHADRILWRFLAGAPIDRKPEVTDRDIYVTADRLGMHRLDRASGQLIWVNQRAEQFVAANPKFVYARDRKGNLLILDALRGTTMAVWDARDWTIAVGNEWTDRSYFAAQDGQIMCLRHRDQLAPHRSRTYFMFRKEEVPDPGAKKEDMEKMEGEKKEKKKEEKNNGKEKEKVGRARGGDVIFCDARWEQRALECGGTTPHWIERPVQNPKRHRAAALHIEPWALS